MEKDLHKRFEKAAETYAKKVIPECISSYEEFFNNTTADFKNGAEQGYKEAIEQVKEWLAINTEEYVRIIDGKEYVERKQLLADFETDMNKF